MGKRGPQPQPAELKRFRGNPGKRAIKHVPTGQPGCPKCPAELAHVRKDWNHYGRILAGLGILRDTDAVTWDALWRTFDKYMQLATQSKAVRIKAENGSATVDPLLALELQYLNTLLRLLDRFGMSPSSRGALNIEAPKHADEFSAFLSRKKA